jgi:hypothetical protein
MTTMRRTLVGLALILLASAAFVQADTREYVSVGEVTAVSVDKGTITLREMAEPGIDVKPGAMQSGVVREFVVNPETKFAMSSQPEAESGSLANLKVGDRITIHYTLGSGKNVATRISSGTSTE